MLIHADSITSRFAPLKVYHFDPGSGSLLIGNEKVRVLLSREEVEQFQKILQGFISEAHGCSLEQETTDKKEVHGEKEVVKNETTRKSL